MRTAILVPVFLFSASLACAQDRMFHDDTGRRGLQELALVGLEYGTVNLGGTAGTVTSTGWNGRLRVTPELLTVGAVRLAGYTGVEVGYAKMSGKIHPQNETTTRLPYRFELGLGADWRVRRDVDLSAYLYGQTIGDNDFVGALSPNDFTMLRLGARRGNLLAQLAVPVHKIRSLSGGMLDVSLWRLRDSWSYGVRLEQFTSGADYLTTGNRPTLRLFSVMFGLVE